MVINVSKRLAGAVFFLAAGVFLLSGIADKSSLSFFMPVLYSRLLIGMSVLLALQYVMKRGKDEKDVLRLDFRNYAKSGSFRILLYLLMIVAYYILVSIVGFAVTTGLFLVASYWFLGVREIKVYIVSLLIMGVLYSVFDFALKVNFPHGFLY